jgi:hypothetical protein
MKRVVLCLLLMATLPSRAQVAAKHVEEPPKELAGDRIKSPMELRFPLAVVDRSFWGEGEVRRDPIAKFVCDGVSYRDFSTEAAQPREGKVRITFRLLLYDEPGIDKRVDLSIGLLRGDTVIGAAVLKNVKVGERKRVPKEMTIELPTSEIDGVSPAPVVRLTTVVRDDP